jgi:uncharacterized protein (DUF1800 family)
MKYYSIVAAGALLTVSAWGQDASPRRIVPRSDGKVTPRAAARFLDQATWGPTPASIAELESLGFTSWLNQQFASNVSNLPDQPLLTSTGTTNQNAAPVQAVFFQNAITGPDQLRQRMAFILSQIWVVSQQSGIGNAYAYPPYWRVFRDNAFGNYRDLIQAVTLNPAMGGYLNMVNNNKTNVAAGEVPNENYARELMQLFTLGLTQLNPDGSPVVVNGVSPPTYTAADVTAVSQVLTGWTFATVPGATAKNNNPAYYFGQMIPVQAEHDTTAKTVLGVKIPANQTVEQDLASLLDILMAQPTMAPFISQQLIQHLVTSNPSPAYIQRVSAVFSNDGTGVAGNLQAVITAILMDPEARAADIPSATESISFGHMREPILFMSNVLRALFATVTATNTISGDASELGENLFNAGSVFSYFSPQNHTEFGLFGPEFEIYSTQTAADRVNLVNSVLYGTGATGFKASVEPYANQANHPEVMITYMNDMLLHGSMSTALQQAALAAAESQPTPATKAQAALYVIFTSGEYQIIK